MSVPALRFKEFNEEWSVKRLTDVAERIGDGLHSTPVYDKNGQYYFVNGNNLTNNKIEISENTKRVNADEYLKHKIELTTQTVLISINGTIGNLAFFNNEKVVLGKSACYINLKKSENKHFVFNLLQTSNITSHFDKELTGSTIKNLSLTTIKNTKAFFPSYQEQTKIANFLTAVDEKISLLTQKHELLTQYKKGVMQKIFSQELRFKNDDGRDFPEWEEHLLGDIATLFNGRAYKQTEWEEHGTPVIRLQNLTGSGDKYYYSNIKLPENQYCNKGDLLYMWSATFGPVWWQGEKAIYHYHIWKIETNENCLTRNYLFYVLDDITAKMKRTSNGSTMDHITKGGMEKLAVILPTVIEQTKIAKFLTSIDDKVTVTKAQLNAVKQYKQGLLQQMFV